MLEENKNENIVPALLEPGEPLISKEQTEAFEKYINEELTKKYNEAVEKNTERPEIKNVITTDRQNILAGDDTVAGITAVENGVIGTGRVAKTMKTSAKGKETKVEKVAIYSTKNVTWSSVGKVYRGYNLVTPDQAEKWLTRSHIRAATPQEIAQEFNS
jgi:hypothetical protein